jgi:multimeric flavodoxin WrbA
MSKHVLILNGSITGEDGSTYQCLCRAIQTLNQREISTGVIQLRNRTHLSPILEGLEAADALLIGTGSYWDSWGSPLQKLIEDIAGLDSTDTLFGKPVGFIVTCHSVGGKATLNRLQGVFNTMGLWTPPHGAMTYAMVSHEAFRLGLDGWKAMETWRLQDIDIVAHNLAEATLQTYQWKSWFVSDEPDEAFRQRWLASGV